MPIKRLASGTHQRLIPLLFASGGAEDKNGIFLGCFSVERADGIADASLLDTVMVWRLLQFLFTLCALESISRL